jgi:phosphatidylinositol-4,5-bisphosphate 3-kinase
MESKKKPLWLTFKDATGGNDFILMLKVGDDLRQDALIMQLLHVMDALWKREELDMQMMLYDCMSTGCERGLLQVVQNATTLGSILMEATDKQNKTSKSGTLSRKLGSAMKALSDFSVIGNWIKEHVEKNISEEKERSREYDRRVQNFMISTAAYCVASYVLGLGDRHNDNLMMTKTGHFFHIDFGHILGNFKSKFGVKRERAPFVFTAAMRSVMKRDDQYEAFVDLCCDVYNILREHAVLLVSLISLAIPCNLPELQVEEDVLWIYEKLLVGGSDEDASQHFRKQLEISLNTRGTRLNDAVHMLAHA